MPMATWRNLHDAIFEMQRKLFSWYCNINVFQTDLARENNVPKENARHFYEEWKASTYFAPEAAKRSAHSFGSRMQRSRRCFPRNLSSIFTIEIRTKLWSEIRIGPIWWIVFRHIIYNHLTWIGAFPVPPHPRNNSNKHFCPLCVFLEHAIRAFRVSHKVNLPFRWDRRNTVQAPVNEDTYFAFIVPSG
jgi:hypothetical protein